MQLTGEETCWPMLGRDYKLASSLEEQQHPFSEGSSKGQHSDVETSTTKTPGGGKGRGGGGDLPGLPLY